MSSNELIQGIKSNSVVVIDARSISEYDILHIIHAKNIHYTNKVHQFILAIKKIRAAQPNKKLVFYCNGYNCSKSYMATNSAVFEGILNVYAYDEGVISFAKKYPERVVLLDEELGADNIMISKKKFNLHLKTHQFFAQELIKARQLKSKFYVLDIRSEEQRMGVRGFMGPFREKRITLQQKQKLIKFLQQVKKENTPLFAYDYVGKQVRWLQYYIENIGISQYYLLNGGSQKKHQDYLDKNILSAR
jgi:rhodanese-related sulfurtransferase